MKQGPIIQIGPYIFANMVRAAQVKTRLFVPHFQGAMKTWAHRPQLAPLFEPAPKFEAGITIWKRYVP